jgi:hypothetical protein
VGPLSDGVLQILATHTLVLIETPLLA